MIKSLGSNVSKFYSQGAEVKKIYSLGTKVWEKETPTPTDDYITDGLVAKWQGTDDLNADNAWVDVINNYLLSPFSDAPTHDTANKLYSLNESYSQAFHSNYALPVGGYTIEIVTRDIRNATTSYSSNDAAVMAPPMNGWGIASGPFLIACAGANSLTLGIARINKSHLARYDTALNSYASNSMDTFTACPNSGLFHNGEKKVSCNENVGGNYFGVGSYESGANMAAYKAKCKVCAVRIYNRTLTDEEIAHNREVDVTIYGE